MLNTPTANPLKDYLDSLRPSGTIARKLALFHCPTFNLDTFKLDVLKNRGYYAYPPRGLQCLATVAATLGFQTDIVDLNYLLLERLHQTDVPQGADLYGMLLQITDEYISAHPEVWIYGVSTGVIVSNIFSVPRHPYLEVLKKLMASGSRLVLTGGAVATVEWKKILKGAYAHLVFKGEAEDRLCYLLSQLFDTPEVAATSGICFSAHGQLQESQGSSRMVDFNQSVLETYTQLPVEKYHQVGCLSPFSRLAGTDKPYASLQLNRGCRMCCSFCGLTQYRGSNQVCQYPVETLMQELRYLVRERGIRHFEWLDEDLLANRAALLEVLNCIAAEKLPVTWAANIGVIAVFLDEEILDAMARSNCLGFRIGVESGNPEMLRKIKKPLTKDKLRKVCERLRQHRDIFVASCWILGFPEERYGQMYDTLQFALELDLSWAQVTIYQDIQETEAEGTDTAAASSNDVNGESFDLTREKAQKVTDFIPSSEKVIGSSIHADSGLRQLSAQEIFAMPAEAAHDPRLKDQFWFAFNLIINYVANKNLRPGGNIEHFSSWLKGLQMTYPQHALMCLFQYFAQSIKGDAVAAQDQWARMLQLLQESEFWQMKFKLFGLDAIVAEIPKSQAEICACLDRALQWYALPFLYPCPDAGEERNQSQSDADLVTNA